MLACILILFLLLAHVDTHVFHCLAMCVVLGFILWIKLLSMRGFMCILALATSHVYIYIYIYIAIAAFCFGSD